MIVKRIFSIGLLMCCLTTVMVGCAASRKPSDPIVLQQVRHSIDSRNFTIVVNQMIPMTGQPQQLTSLYSLRVNNDSVFSWLPYFGRAYSVPYGGGQGLIFDGIITNYQIETNKKGTSRISFSSKTSEDTYVFNLEVQANGGAHVRVNSNHRQGISFYGDLVRE